MKAQFFTIGHSTRTIEEFYKLLQIAQVTMVVDIRSVPKSRTNPQYNKDTLPETLATLDIGYEHIAELGGLRGKTELSSQKLNEYWENKSFRNYADYALTAPFNSGLNKFIELGSERKCTLMCSEAVWWRCHRRIVADHLIARGLRVFHLMGTDKIQQAIFSESARISENGSVIYPRENVPNVVS